MSFAHTPWEASKSPFTIGLEPLGARDWIEPDEFLARDLAEKERLLAARRDEAFRETRDTRAAQAEVLALLAARLPARFPRIYAREGAAIRVMPAGRTIQLDGDDPPLLTAARLVQEDVCLMRRDTAGWRLAAGALCFPSGWSLAEKMGSDLAGIHAPVPGFAGRMETVVERVFDNLRADAPLLRFNWSIYASGALRQPPGQGAAIRPDRDNAAAAHVRVERQTLTRLPETGAVLFTIRVYSDAIADLANHPRGRLLAAALRARLAALSSDEARYKGLGEAREAVVAALGEIMKSASPP